MHKSVLLKTAIDWLDLQKGDVYLDATLGAGGHAEEVYARTKGDVAICGIDADETAISIARERLELVGAKPHLALLNFRDLDRLPTLLDMDAPAKKPNKMLFDLGWSAMQVEDGGRGFSFLRDEPLIMTLSQPQTDQVTAYEVVNVWQEANLADVIYGYGEEKYSRRIARAIVEAREKKPIKSSLELAEIVKSAVPVWYRFGRIHPATRTFQAIRIAVNDELQTLKTGLEKGFEILQKSGRIAVISFHSLEDRIVKNFFRELADGGKGEILTKKPIVADEVEVAENPRSRSAKLRVLKKI